MENKKYNLLQAKLDELGITQTELSLRLGNSIETVGRWCRQDRVMKLDDLYKVADVLEVDVYDLLPQNEKGKGLWMKQEELVKLEEGKKEEEFPYNRLDHYLKEKKVYGNELAMELGVGQNAISRWRQNKAQPRIQVLFSIGKYLRINPRKLLANVEYGEDA